MQTSRVLMIRWGLAVGQFSLPGVGESRGLIRRVEGK